MSGSVASGGVKAEPNLTPILDMVFQLVTFFMLVINFKSAELDLSLTLPVVGSARPVDSGGTDRLLVLNVKDTEGKVNLSIYGHPVPMEQIKSYLEGESNAALMAAHLTRDDVQTGGKELPDIVVIRADQGTPFGDVNFVVTSCQEQGFRRFALKAINARPIPQ